MWNYRIVRHRTRSLTWYGLHEVYYKKDGKTVDLWAPKPDAVGDDPKDMVAGLAIQLRDATRSDMPILNQKDMPGATKPMTTCEHCGHKLKAMPKKTLKRNHEGGGK